MMRLHDELQRLKREVERDSRALPERITAWEKMPAGEYKDYEECHLKQWVRTHKYHLNRISEIESELRAYDEHIAEQSTSTLLCDKVWNRRSNR